MTEFIETKEGYIATSAIISIERSSEGKAILNLVGETIAVSERRYEDVIDSLGPVIPDTTGCLAVEILIDDGAEPDENGNLPYNVWKLPVLAWRIVEGRAVPITAAYGNVTHVLYPDGSVDELTITMHASLDDAVRSALNAAKG